MPLVSVCLPTYEPKPEHLQAAISSVLDQTFSDWELIINDESPNADVQKIVEPFLNDQRVKFFKNEKRLGIGGNWNATIRKSTAPMISYMFQDDLWYPQYLEKMTGVLDREKDIGFVATNHLYRIEGTTASASTGIYKEVELLRNAVMKNGRIHRHEFLRHWVQRGLRPNLIGEPSFVVLRVSLMQRIGPFLEDMKQGLDAEYWVRALLESDGWWIAENLGEFRVHASGTTAKNEESGAGRMDRLRTLKILAEALPPGPMKKLTKSVFRREIIKMGWKWLKRKLL
ncbi:MAG: glycosyltransferase [Candidatus Peribacteraceae bacterium]|nr:glycosyltransferase [Candidatus Peribacteraceae bacterium]